MLSREQRVDTFYSFDANILFIQDFIFRQSAPFTQRIVNFNYLAKEIEKSTLEECFKFLNYIMANFEKIDNFQPSNLSISESNDYFKMVIEFLVILAKKTEYYLVKNANLDTIVEHQQQYYKFLFVIKNTLLNSSSLNQKYPIKILEYVLKLPLDYWTNADEIYRLCLGAIPRDRVNPEWLDPYFRECSKYRNPEFILDFVLILKKSYGKILLIHRNPINPIKLEHFLTIDEFDVDEPTLFLLIDSTHQLITKNKAFTPARDKFIKIYVNKFLTQKNLQTRQLITIFDKISDDKGTLILKFITNLPIRLSLLEEAADNKVDDYNLWLRLARLPSTIYFFSTVCSAQINANKLIELIANSYKLDLIHPVNLIGIFTTLNNQHVSYIFNYLDNQTVYSLFKRLDADQRTLLSRKLETDSLLADTLRTWDNSGKSQVSINNTFQLINNRKFEDSSLITYITIAKPGFTQAKKNDERNIQNSFVLTLPLSPARQTSIDIYDRPAIDIRATLATNNRNLQDISSTVQSSQSASITSGNSQVFSRTSTINPDATSLSNIQTIPARKAPDKKIPYFSRKYLGNDFFLQDFFLLKEQNRRPTISYQHTFQFKTIEDSLVANSTSKRYERVIGDNHTKLSYYHSSAIPNENSTVTFIFAGRELKAYLPDLMRLGENQHCIIVITRSELDKFTLDSYPPNLDVLVIEQLGNEARGSFDSLGIIQARRLAAFYASFCWNIQECLYLDDNIASIGVNFPVQDELTWSQITAYLKQKRSQYNTLIAGFSTISNKPKAVAVQSDYCYKLFAMNFQEICRVLNLSSASDIFILGYPPAYAATCMQDYFFQILIDFANHKQNVEKSLLYTVVLEEAGLKRAIALPGLAKKNNANYQTIKLMVLSEFCQNITNTRHKQWIKLTLNHLKTAVEFNLQQFAKSQNYQQTRHDLQDLHTKNAVINNRRSFSEMNNSSNSVDNAPTPNIKKQCVIPWEIFGTKQKISELVSWRSLSNYLEISSIKEHSYEYQQNALRCLSQANTYHGCMKIATGCGKTRLQILLVDYLTRNKIKGPIYIVTANINLVEQFYQDFLDVIDLQKPSFSLEPKDIITISSHNPIQLNWKHYYKNKILQKAVKVAIFCSKSFKLMQEYLSNHPETSVVPPALILLDECHLYPPITDKIVESRNASLAFSATPNHRVEPIFNFSRVESMEKKITAPMIIDRVSYSLKKDNTTRWEKIAEMIQSHCHPGSGLPLENSKGIIFVSNIREADELKTIINNRLGKSLAICIHSKAQDYHACIREFNQRPIEESGIAIVINMLKVGYNDKGLSWTIIARNNTENSADVVQMIGRVLRYHHEKIAYILADVHLDIKQFEPAYDAIALQKAHPNYFFNNHQILYFNIRQAIQQNDSFDTYKTFFQYHGLRGCSLNKHLELLLVANDDWRMGMCHFNPTLTMYYNNKDLIACFVNQVYGCLIQKSPIPEMYSVQKFKAFLMALLRYLDRNFFIKCLENTHPLFSCYAFVTRIAQSYQNNEYLEVFTEIKEQVVKSEVSCSVPMR